MTETAMLRGAITALVTPFTDQGAFDEASFQHLLAPQLDAGIDGLVPVGTTGEAPTQSAEEREHVIAPTIAAVRERRPLLPFEQPDVAKVEALLRSVSLLGIAAR